MPTPNPQPAASFPRGTDADPGRRQPGPGGVRDADADLQQPVVPGGPGHPADRQRRRGCAAGCLPGRFPTRRLVPGRVQPRHLADPHRHQSIVDADAAPARRTRGRAVRHRTGSGPGDRQHGRSDRREAPSTAAFRQEVRRLLERRLDQLPVAFRTVFVMRDVNEMSVEETAEALAIPASTVRTRLFRARARKSRVRTVEQDQASLRPTSR